MIDLDADLERMTPAELAAEVQKLRTGIRRVCNANGHDVCWYLPELFTLLPEKDTQWAQTLPPRAEFLQKCAAFRDSLDAPIKLSKSR